LVLFYIDPNYKVFLTTLGVINASYRASALVSKSQE